MFWTQGSAIWSVEGILVSPRVYPGSRKDWSLCAHVVWTFEKLRVRFTIPLKLGLTVQSRSKPQTPYIYIYRTG